MDKVEVKVVRFIPSDEPLPTSAGMGGMKR
jgi:hypothetical protein